MVGFGLGCCCGECPCNCHQSGCPTTEYEIQISGVANTGFCSNCGDFNGTFVVTNADELGFAEDHFLDDTFLPNSCVFLYEFESLSCNWGAHTVQGIFVEIGTDLGGGSYLLRVSIATAPDSNWNVVSRRFGWTKTYSGLINESDNGNGGCRFDELPLPSNFNLSGLCTVASATCLISSVP